MNSIGSSSNTTTSADANRACEPVLKKKKMKASRDASSNGASVGKVCGANNDKPSLGGETNVKKVGKVCREKNDNPSVGGEKKVKKSSGNEKKRKKSTGVDEVVAGNQTQPSAGEIVNKQKSSTKGPKMIAKKDIACKKPTRFHLLKKVRCPVSVKTGLSHISNQLFLFPVKTIRELFVQNGLADISESVSLSPLEAAKKRNERAVSFCEKSELAFTGREAVNTLLVVFYNPASVSVLMEEIQNSSKDVPEHVLVVRFDTAFVAIITDSTMSRFPYRSWVEHGDSSSCFLWFTTKDVSWTQKFPVQRRWGEKMEVLQKVTPLGVVGHILVAYFESTSQPWGADSTATDKTNYHIYLKPLPKLNDGLPLTAQEVVNESWVESITSFVSRFSFVKSKRVPRMHTVLEGVMGVVEKDVLDRVVGDVLGCLVDRVEEAGMKDSGGAAIEGAVDEVVQVSQYESIDAVGVLVDRVEEAGIEDSGGAAIEGAVDEVVIDAVDKDVMEQDVMEKQVVEKDIVEKDVIEAVDFVVSYVVEQDGLAPIIQENEVNAEDEHGKHEDNDDEQGDAGDNTDEPVGGGTQVPNVSIASNANKSPSTPKPAVGSVQESDDKPYEEEEDDLSLGVCGMSKESDGYFQFDEPLACYGEEDNDMATDQDLVQT